MVSQMSSNLLRSLPLRATLLATAALLALAALLVVAIGWQANRALAERTLQSLDADVIDLRRIFERGGIDLLAIRVTDLAANAGTNLYALDAPDGRRLAGTAALAVTDKITSGAAFAYRPPNSAVDHLAVARRIRIPLSQAGDATLIVARDIEDQRTLARQIQLTAVTGLGLLSLLALALGLAARRALLTRIETISATSRSIMAGDMTQRIPRANTSNKSGDEIDQLAGDLNAMLARMESLMQALRDVSDNIAHDLKTPLNRLRNSAEQAMRDTASPATHRDALGKVIEEADGLIQTFNALLLIARLEPGSGDEPMDVVDVTKLVLDVADLYAPVAEDAGLIVRVLSSPPCVAPVNRQLLGQAVANLLDNAIKYSTGAHSEPIGPVDVSFEETATTIDIAVSDRGPGIAPGDRDRALKRFVRLEKSRSLPGTGLGLSLVAAVARLHRGSVRLEDNAPGLRVVLSLPKASATLSE
jgi:signal transduction histidine kinase